MTGDRRQSRPRQTDGTGAPDSAPGAGAASALRGDGAPPGPGCGEIRCCGSETGAESGGARPRSTSPGRRAWGPGWAAGRRPRHGAPPGQPCVSTGRIYPEQRLSLASPGLCLSGQHEMAAQARPSPLEAELPATAPSNSPPTPPQQLPSVLADPGRLLPLAPGSRLVPFPPRALRGAPGSPLPVGAGVLKGFAVEADTLVWLC